MDLTQASSIYPTVDEVNALPEKVRRYIHDLETRMSAEGKSLDLLELANERDALQRRVDELEAQLALHRRVEQLEAQVALLTHPKMNA
jgi:prefoldin subunit 5